jgi:hypothetical protein
MTTECEKLTSAAGTECEITPAMIDAAGKCLRAYLGEISYLMRLHVVDRIGVVIATNVAGAQHEQSADGRIDA